MKVKSAVRHLVSLLFPVFFLGVTLFAQKNAGSETELRKQADKYFSEEDFDGALNPYSRLLSLKPSDAVLNYRYGVCLLIAGKEKSNAASFLETASASPLVPAEVWYFLGKAYMVNENYDKALLSFQKYSAQGSKNKKPDAEFCASNARNAIELQKSPRQMTILSEREENSQGFYNFYEQDPASGRLVPMAEQFISSVDREKQKQPLMFISSDKQFIVYAAYGKSMDRGKDIFLSRKQANGTWGEPQNLGSSINTVYDEDLPMLDKDGKTLYFSSKGHNSIGGSDIFKSVLDLNSGQWSEPENLGIPLNTVYDDFYFYPSSDGETFTYSTFLNASRGKTTIRKVELPSLSGSTVKISGVYTPIDQRVRRDARISIMDSGGRGIIATTNTDPRTGYYELYLPPGNEYMIVVEGGGYLPHAEMFNLPEAASGNNLRQIVKLNKTKEKEELTLQNFFAASDVPTQTMTRSYSPADSSSLVALNIQNSTVYVTAPSSENKSSAATSNDQSASSNLPQIKLEKKDKFDPTLERQLSSDEIRQKQEEESRSMEIAYEEKTNEEPISDTISNSEIARLAYNDAKIIQTEADNLKKQSVRIRSYAEIKDSLAIDFKESAVNAATEEERKENLNQATALQNEALDLFSQANNLDKLAADKQKQADDAMNDVKSISGNDKSLLARMDSDKKKREEKIAADLNAIREEVKSASLAQNASAGNSIVTSAADAGTDVLAMTTEKEKKDNSVSTITTPSSTISSIASAPSSGTKQSDKSTLPASSSANLEKSNDAYGQGNTGNVNSIASNEEKTDVGATRTEALKNKLPASNSSNAKDISAPTSSSTASAAVSIGTRYDSVSLAVNGSRKTADFSAQGSSESSAVDRNASLKDSAKPYAASTLENQPEAGEAVSGSTSPSNQTTTAQVSTSSAKSTERVNETYPGADRTSAEQNLLSTAEPLAANGSISESKKDAAADQPVKMVPPVTTQNTVFGSDDGSVTEEAKSSAEISRPSPGVKSTSGGSEVLAERSTKEVSGTPSAASLTEQKSSTTDVSKSERSSAGLPVENSLSSSEKNSTGSTDTKSAAVSEQSLATTNTPSTSLSSSTSSNSSPIEKSGTASTPTSPSTSSTALPAEKSGTASVPSSSKNSNTAASQYKDEINYTVAEQSTYGNKKASVQQETTVSERKTDQSVDNNTTSLSNPASTAKIDVKANEQKAITDATSTVKGQDPATVSGSESTVSSSTVADRSTPAASSLDTNKPVETTSGNTKQDVAEQKETKDNVGSSSQVAVQDAGKPSQSTTPPSIGSPSRSGVANSPSNAISIGASPTPSSTTSNDSALRSEATSATAQSDAPAGTVQQNKEAVAEPIVAPVASTSTADKSADRSSVQNEGAQTGQTSPATINTNTVTANSSESTASGSVNAPNQQTIADKKENTTIAEQTTKQSGENAVNSDPAQREKAPVNKVVENRSNIAGSDQPAAASPFGSNTPSDAAMAMNTAKETAPASVTSSGEATNDSLASEPVRDNNGVSIVESGKSTVQPVYTNPSELPEADLSDVNTKEEARLAYETYRTSGAISRRLSRQSEEMQDRLSKMKPGSARDSLVTVANEMTLESVRQWQLSQKQLRDAKEIDPLIEDKVMNVRIAAAKKQSVGTSVTPLAGTSKPATGNAVSGSTEMAVNTPSRPPASSPSSMVMPAKRDSSGININHPRYNEYIETKQQVTAKQVETIDVFTEAIQLNKKASDEKQQQIALLDSAYKETDTIRKAELEKSAGEFKVMSEQDAKLSEQKFAEARAKTGEAKQLSSKMNSIREEIVNTPVAVNEVQPKRSENTLSASIATDRSTQPSVPAVKSSSSVGSDQPVPSVQYKSLSEAISPVAQNDLKISKSELDAQPLPSVEEVQEFARVSFGKSDKPIYSKENPIPMDTKLPAGLVFKVQIGAFRKPVDPDNFKKVQPLTGESTRPGWIRYCVGLFQTFEPANLVKKEMRNAGYKDAFVVAYFNGRRIGLNEAYAMVSGNAEMKTAYRAQAMKETAMLQSLNIDPVSSTIETDADERSFYPFASAKKGTSVNSTQDRSEANESIVYSVQVGVYRTSKTPDVLKTLDPVEVTSIKNGLFRYTFGVYDQYAQAAAAKKLAVSKGIADAFIIAYKNGQRVSPTAAAKVTDAGTPEVKNAVVAEAPAVAPVKKEEETSSVSSDTSPIGSSSTKLMEAIPAEKASTNGQIVFKVQIGAFRQMITYEKVMAFLSVSDKGITQITDDRGLHIFFVGNCTDLSCAAALKQEVVAKGLADAFVVAIKDGRKVPITDDLKAR